MKKSISAALLVFSIWCRPGTSGAAEPHFIKLSDHCYYMQLKDTGENVMAVMTDDGILLVNPPKEPDLTDIILALKALTPKTVRWVIFSEPGLCPNSEALFFKGLNPIFLTSTKLRSLSMPESDMLAGGIFQPPKSSWLLFGQQMRLFPSGLEVRIIALQHPARTGGDIVVFVPEEKVLFVGALYETARYPDIDSASGGSAIGWFDGMKQVIDAVPVLKPAIAPAKSDPDLDKDRTLEEGITVLSSRGEPSNLQNMKDLLESSRKLQSDISRAIRQGRTCSDFLASPRTDPYRSYSNLASFASQLFAEKEAESRP
jgi:hypothetical protein